MAPKSKKKKQNMLLAQMEQDSKSDTLMNPASWNDVGKWASMYELTYKDVINLILDEARRNDKLKYKTSHFEICLVIEKYRNLYDQNNKKEIAAGKLTPCSVNKAIVDQGDHIAALLGHKKSSLKIMNNADTIHRRIVKGNPRRWKDFLLDYYAHEEKN